mgnify:CR=1 FL=1
MSEIVYDLVVIGGGPAGLAAAISAKQNGLKNVLVLERDNRAGGILLQCIHNGFGLHYFGEELTGPEYAGRFVKQALENEVEIKVNTMVLEILPAKNSGESHIVTAINSTDGLMNLKTKTIALAMGCRERTRGALVIPGTRPAGIFTAGSAQRFVNIDGYLPGRKVVILGSGDIGLIMARRLTLEGAEVKLVCEIMNYPAGLARNMAQCLYNFDIPLKLSTTIVQIHGSDRVTGVTIAKVDDHRKPIPGTEEFIECDTVLLSVGLIPENEISIAAGVAMDSITSGPAVNQNMETSIPGIFACGNSVHVHDLVDYVTEESLLAGKCAADYVKNQNQNEEKNAPVVLPVTPGNRVRYTVPQHIDLSEKQSNGDAPRIMFRATDVYRSVTVVVYSGTTVIAQQKKRIVRPGEMQTISLKEKDLERLLQVKQPLTVSIEMPEDSID